MNNTVVALMPPEKYTFCLGIIKYGLKVWGKDINYVTDSVTESAY